MGTYNMPRNVKGEGRILYIFSTRALIYTFIGIAIGFLFYLFFKLIGLLLVGYILIGMFGVIGYVIATFKMPESNAFSITKKTGGENLNDILIRLIKFRMKKNKIYLYKDVKRDILKKEDNKYEQ